MSIKDMKDKVKKSTQEAAKKAKEMGQEAVSKVDVDKIKVSAEEAKQNANVESLKGLDNKKKGILVGGVVAIVLGTCFLFIGGGSSSANILEDSFPIEASAEERCEFFAQYERSIYQSVADGVSGSDVFTSMQKDVRTDQTDKINEKFYENKAEWTEEKVVKLANSLEEARSQMTEAQISGKIEKEYTRALRRCKSLM